MKIFSYIVVFIIGAVCGIWVFLLLPKDIIQNDDKFEVVNNYSLTRDVTVYMPWWDQDRAFETIKQNKGKVKYIKAFWYEAKKDGSIKKYTGAENDEIEEFAKQNSIGFIPVINNDFSAETAKELVSNSEVSAKHLDNLVDMVQENEFDGLEIDYEGLDAEDGANFSVFITNLSSRLHQNNKVLHIAVHAKTSDEGTWDGPKAQDWNVIGEAVDQVNVMAYDYSWATSEAGNIAPLGWIEEVLDYAITKLPKEKISLGINFYGYDWVKEAGQDVLYEDILELISEHKPTISTTDEFEKTFLYTKDDENHTVYFADSETVTKRLELVSKHDLGGISIWRVGGEDPAIWAAVASNL